MTTAEMLNAFRVSYDIVNLEGPGYEDNEILILLNQAQSIEVLKEVAIRRWTYITNLIRNETYSTVVPAWSTLPYHRYITPLADDYIGYVGSRSLITRTTFKSHAIAEWTDNILIKKEEAGLYLTNTNNRLILLKPRVFEEGASDVDVSVGGNISIIHDRNTTFSGVNDFFLEFVHIPEDIETGVDCAVNEILHERIVKTAVNLAKNIFNPQEAGNSKQVDTLLSNPEP
jgi:hypothetical protein